MKNIVSNVKGKALALSDKLFAGAALMVASGASMADAIDTSGPVGQITLGLAAVGAIGAAWVGFKYLQKVWSRV